MNRGSSSSIASQISVPTGFNEAPIHESGKFLSPVHFLDPLLCFNEAPIHESGKWE